MADNSIGMLAKTARALSLMQALCNLRVPELHICPRSAL